MDSIKQSYKIVIVSVIIAIVFLLFLVFNYQHRADETFWDSVKLKNTSLSYQEYLKTYPNGKHFKVAAIKYDSALWSETEKMLSFEAYQTYIDKNKQGTHVLEAKKIIQKLHELPILKGWKIEKSNYVFFPNKEKFLITTTTKAKNEYDKIIQINVFQCEYDRIYSNENVWSPIKKSEEVEAYQPESTYLLKTNSNALLLSVFNNGGAHGISNYFITKLDSIGNVQVETHSDPLAEIKGDDNSIIATEYIERLEYHIVNQEIKCKVIERSDMASSNAIKLYFKYNSGEIVASNNSYININVGQTIAFIPEGTEGGLRSDFNSGNINIYTDVWGGELSTCDANEVWPGNSIKLDKCGIFKFLLYSPYCSNTVYSDGTYNPTFYVNVSVAENKPITNTQSKSVGQNSTQSSACTGGYQRSNRDYFTCTSAVHEFLSRHSFKSDDGSRLSYSIGDLTISYSRGKLRFTNIEIRIVSQDVAILSAMDVGSGRTLRIRINAAYGEIVDLNDNSTSFQAVN